MLYHESLVKRGHWLFRRRGQLPLVLLPWLVALVFLNPESTVLMRTPWWQVLCLATALLGFLLRCATVSWSAPGTSGRNTNAQVADSLNTLGIYSIVRNPLYVANYLMLLAPVMLTGHGWSMVVFTLIFWLYYERIIVAEESFLSEKFGDRYAEYAARTPAWIVNPTLFLRPEGRPSLRRIFRREYVTQLSMIGSLALMDLVAGQASGSPTLLSPLMQAALILSLAVFLLGLLLVKSTRLLHD